MAILRINFTSRSLTAKTDVYVGFPTPTLQDMIQHRDSYDSTKQWPVVYLLHGAGGDGFEWINADDNTRSIFSFVRHSQDGKNNLLFVINFTPVARPDYRVGVPRRKQYHLVLNSDAAEFGGSGKEQPEVYRAVKSECDGRPYSFAYDLPAYGVAVFKF